MDRKIEKYREKRKDVEKKKKNKMNLKRRNELDEEETQVR